MRRGLGLSTVGAIVGVCGSALGQNALDRPLDRNPQRGTGGYNPARQGFTQELQLRNAIITGNAPAGFSLRADVGYQAPGEFMARLGTNDFFAYRRDSYYSGLGGLGIRGTDALQYQFAMTTGNTPPPGFTGSVALPRSGASTRVDARMTQEERSVAGISRATEDPSKPGADLRGLSLMSLRSPSAYMSTRGLEATMVGRLTAADGKQVDVSASPLRGISFDTFAPPKDPKDATAPRPGTTPTLGERTEKSDPGMVSAKSSTKEDPKVEASAGIGKTAYEDLMDRLKGGGDKPAEPGDAKDPGKTAVASTWQTQLEELRRQLREGAAPPAKPGDTGKPDTSKPDVSDPTRPDAPKVDPDKPDAAKPSRETPAGPDVAERIRQAGTEVERLAPRGFDAYAAHMQAGQEHIAAGAFFNAEERFTTALALKPGDPMAAIGRVHAELGAGMFLSASANLRMLFVEHPEVVSLKYKPELMPSKERLVTLIDRLNEMINDAADGNRRDNGLLLAYIGFQTDNTVAMKRGLELMAEPPKTAPGGKPSPGPDPLQTLATLLSRVWLPPPPAAPAPGAPATPPPAATPKPEPNK